MNCDDVLVLWDGSNDISKNNMRNAIPEVFELVKDSKESNIVLISAPHRHDLNPDSCVNKEVCKYNRSMKKLVKLYTNVNYFETDLEKSHFTKHGFHLNSEGKDFLVQQLAIQIELILNKPKSPPISTYWETPNSVCTSDTSYDLIKDSNLLQQRGKCPRQKHPDFFLDLTCNSPNLLNQSTSNSNFFTIFRQNIRSLRDKHQELLTHLFPNFPHVLCITEHHLKAPELQNICIDHYTLGAHFCRTSYAKGGVVIYILNTVRLTSIN